MAKSGASERATTAKKRAQELARWRWLTPELSALRRHSLESCPHRPNCIKFPAQQTGDLMQFGIWVRRQPGGEGSIRADGPRSDVRPLPRSRDDDDVRQPGLDRAADARRLPRGLPL